MKIIKTTDYNNMSKKAASIIAAQVIIEPDSVLGLATGSTPLGTYSKLVELCAADEVDFTDVVTFNLDEYLNLDPTHDQSYRNYMNKNLFNKINIKLENTNVPNGMASNVEEECLNYDKKITELGGISLQLLGIGHNGHIGFNEPDEYFEKSTHCVTLDEKTIEANSRFFENADMVPKKAITAGMESIMQAKKILLVVNGEDKKDILNKALFGPITPMVPASILQLHPDLTVISCNAL